MQNRSKCKHVYIVEKTHILENANRKYKTENENRKCVQIENYD